MARPRSAERQSADRLAAALASAGVPPTEIRDSLGTLHSLSRSNAYRVMTESKQTESPVFEPAEPAYSFDPLQEISDAIERLRYCSKQLMKAGDFKAAAMVEKLFIDKQAELKIMFDNESDRVDAEIESLHRRRN